MTIYDTLDHLRDITGCPDGVRLDEHVSAIIIDAHKLKDKHARLKNAASLAMRHAEWCDKHDDWSLPCSCHVHGLLDALRDEE